MDSLKQYKDAGMNDQQTINLLSNELIGLKAFKEKNELEFTRFKQDCRKRSLEMAHDEARRVGGITPQIKDPSNLVHQEEAKPFDIIATANQYYKWLTEVN